MALELWNRIKTLPAKSVGTPVLVLMCLGMVMLPMPAFLLDMFFTFNITISMLILFVTIYTKKPTEFASFPSVLLIATLLRLSLNVASTRVILVYGHGGGASAGEHELHASGPGVRQAQRHSGDYQLCGNYQGCGPYFRGYGTLYPGCHARETDVH